MSAIQLPHDWRPRTYQVPLWNALNRGTRRAIAVWHRRAGKDLFALNYTAVQSQRVKGLYWHVLPTYRQGRKAVWDGITGSVADDLRPRKFMDHWPSGMVKRRRDDEMTLWLTNDSMWSVVGTDDVDRLMGANPVGVVFSEYSMQNEEAYRLISPILAANGGWALFISTPRGRNHFYRLWQLAKENPQEWFSQTLTIDDTQAIPAEEVEKDRRSGMSEALIQQEYYCSFEAPLEGSFYMDQMLRMHTEGRICEVPTMPNVPVHTSWDLGIADQTAIWFFQQHQGVMRFLDYYYAAGQPLAHYAGVLQRKRDENNWVYGMHLLPHDARQRDFQTAKPRVQALRELGFPCRALPKFPFEDGIDLVRGMLTRSLIDKQKCQVGVQALKEYRKKESGFFEPDGSPMYSKDPVHDWSSHAADAFRVAACGIRPEESMRNRPIRLYPKLAIV